jgi:cell division protein FtsL
MANGQTPSGGGMRLTFDHVKTILSMLVIPLVIWGVKLEVNDATTQQSIAALEAKIVEQDSGREEVRKNSISLAQLKERIDAANSTLGDIKDLIRRSRDSK